VCQPGLVLRARLLRQPQWLERSQRLPRAPLLLGLRLAWLPVQPRRLAWLLQWASHHLRVWQSAWVQPQQWRKLGRPQAAALRPGQWLRVRRSHLRGVERPLPWLWESHRRLGLHCSKGMGMGVQANQSWVEAAHAVGSTRVRLRDTLRAAETAATWSKKSARHERGSRNQKERWNINALVPPGSDTEMLPH